MLAQSEGDTMATGESEPIRLVFDSDIGVDHLQSQSQIDAECPRCKKAGHPKTKTVWCRGGKVPSGTCVSCATEMIDEIFRMGDRNQ